MDDAEPISISDQTLIDLNSKGLIPGPGESAADFMKRAEWCLNLKTTLDHPSSEFGIQSQGTASMYQSVDRTLKAKYDFFPEWTPIFFSNDQLKFWHGASAWIFQQTKLSPTGAIVQLRENFLKSPIYLGMYTRDELLLHEFVHTGRMMFQEPQFEEILAYRTSFSSFRSYLGPIIQSSAESLFFIMLLMGIFVGDLYLMASGAIDIYTKFFLLKAIPVAFIGYAFLRLWNRHRIFNRALTKLKSCLNDNQKAESVIYRLTDKEIRLIANMEISQIREYAEKSAQTELRWRLIRMAYFL